MSVRFESDKFIIREVWNHNLESEFELIRDIVDDYPFIAMDTEFPGRVLRPVEDLKSVYQNYKTLKTNVDLLKLIQLGLTFADEKGNLPTCGTDKYCIWQFNFREFNLNEDFYAHDSIQLLVGSGIDFVKNGEMGVDATRFGELLVSSGVVLSNGVQWVTFHSGDDFAYLLKVLTQKNLPDTLDEFLMMIKMFFPVLYDIKHMMRFCNGLHGGLSKVADRLGVERVGVCHQAGSDSFLTWCTFLKLQEIYFEGSVEKYGGILYDLEIQI